MQATKHAVVMKRCGKTQTTMTIRGRVITFRINKIMTVLKILASASVAPAVETETSTTLDRPASVSDRGKIALIKNEIAPIKIAMMKARSR